jgi:hypothetical protein
LEPWRRAKEESVKLEPLMEYRAELKPGTAVGDGPYGQRIIVDVSGGHFEGPRLRGKILPSGADWLLLRSDGMGLLDVRATFETDDDAFIYLTYYGILEVTEQVQAALAGDGSTEYGDLYFMTQPRFETGDPRYAWLNSVVAVGEGRLRPNAVEYRVYQAVNG